MPSKNTIKFRFERKCSFVFISGITDVPLDKIFDKGACAFMSKPFEVEELLAEINWLLMRPPRFVRKTDTEEMAMR